MQKIAKVIQHVAFEDLGNLASILKENEYVIQYHQAVEITGKVQKECQECDLLIILGGPIGVYQNGQYPFLDTEIAIVKYRLQHKLPLLGICLGAQIIARTMGSQVYPGKQKEIGWASISNSNNHDNSCLFMHELTQDHVKVLHWHGDTFDIPDGAVHLASSSLYPNQAFSVGSYCLALQFHPEVTRTGMEHWFVGHALEIEIANDIDVEKLREDTQRYADNLTTQVKGFWRKWLKQIG